MTAATQPSAALALLVAGLASGQGKTTVCAALARRLRRDGLRVAVFKTGADFLDPMMLARAAGAPVYNLDLWMVGADACRALLDDATARADVILVEGAMGLYDGQPSAADLAVACGLPVLALVDASAMAQTAGAIVLGLRDYGTAAGPIALAGVVANRVAGAAHGTMVAAALRDSALVATLPNLGGPGGGPALPERHLGLLPPEAVRDIDARIDALADAIAIDAQAWAALPRRPARQRVDALPSTTAATPLAGRTIAIASDAAFAFIYPANLDCLRALGARIVLFSPLADAPVPAEADAVWLPGGYPELHTARLATAQTWRASIQSAHHAGLPILAECGGLMALSEAIETDAGGAPMAALLPGRVRMQARPVAIGPQYWDTPQGRLRGHAFHYSSLATPLAPHSHARHHPTATRGEAIYRHGSLTASYFHAYFPSCAAAVAALLSGAPA